MTWTTELANAEAAEQSYRSARRGSQNSYFRFDGRGGVLLTNWIAARAAASSVKVPGSDCSFWANVAIRATSAMGPSWSVVTGQPLAALFDPSSSEIGTHQPFGFPGGTLDGLVGGLLTQWSQDVWVASGRSVPNFAFPPQEVWSYIFANSITLAGPT